MRHRAFQCALWGAVGLVLGMAVGPAQAQISTVGTVSGQGAPRARQPPRQEPLLLEIQVNDRLLPGVHHCLVLADGRLLMPVEAWKDARLVQPQEMLAVGEEGPGHALEAASGLSYLIDRKRLLLIITARPEAFTETVVSMSGTRADLPSAAATGAYLNYDLSALSSSSNATGNVTVSRQFGAYLEAVAFSSAGSLGSAVVLRGDERSNGALRTDTWWRRDMPGRMETLMIGDTLSASSGWSRPVRFGGIRYGRDFSLAPGYVTYPMPSISGAAALPSTVDLLVNNRRQTSTAVQPGPFELSNVPITAGAGQVQLVVKDMLGRETVVTQSYYTATQLLSPGLSDFSFEAGLLRRNYGIESNDYGALFGAGSYRRGLTDTITGEVRAEVQGDRSAAGIGATMVVGQLGLLSLSGGYSVSDIGQGGRYLASIQRIGPKGGVTLSASHQDQGFLPFGTRPQDRRQKDLLMASAGTLFGAGVTAGVSLTRQSDWGGDTFTFAGLNVSVPLPRNMFLSMWVNHQLETGGGTSAGLNLIVPLENRRLVTASSVRAPDGRMIDTLQATQSLPAGPGWGWSVTASDDPYQFGRGRLGYNSSYGQVTAEASAGHDSYGLRFGANGSLGWLQGLGFASRRIDHGAFAVVKVGDVEGVPVSLSNQVIARTNAKGMALVPGLLPYQMNRLSIDPVDVPLGVEVRGTQQRVIPYARSGVFLDFPVKRTRNALVILMQPDGKPVPGGARVTVLPGSRAYTLARRGEVYLTDLEPDSRIEVRWAGGGCDLSLTVPPNPLEDEAPRIGPLTCGDSE